MPTVREFQFTTGPESSTPPSIGTPTDDTDFLTLGYVKENGSTYDKTSSGSKTFSTSGESTVFARHTIQSGHTYTVQSGHDLMFMGKLIVASGGKIIIESGGHGGVV